MGTHSAYKLSLYQQLEILPENLTGEIINGQLHTQPRPALRHLLAASSLADELIGPFQKGRGGPGGWWIIGEPEVHFILDVEVMVPDLAGWRKERLSVPPSEHKINSVPDWVCEVFSPSTKSKDQEVKMPLYAKHGVKFAWLIDPIARTIEAFELGKGKWYSLGLFRDNATVSIAPFTATQINLADIWTTP